MRVMVTGAAGQLGGAIVQRFGGGHDVLPLTRGELDVTREADVARLVAAERPDVIINCTAYNDVDGAEDHARDAFEGNAFAVLALARAARDVSATLVHYGTDFIFDGLADRPYTRAIRRGPAASMGCRSCSENGSLRMPRLTTSSALKACSEGLAPRAASIASSMRSVAASQCACSRIVPSRPAT